MHRLFTVVYLPARVKYLIAMFASERIVSCVESASNLQNFLRLCEKSKILSDHKRALLPVPEGT
jgi:hypothetical protein